MLNPFETDAFNVVSLTQAINILPNNYGRLNQMNLMPTKGVRTREVLVEEQNGILNLLQTQPVGSPGTQNKMGKRKVRSFSIPHIPHDDTILPQEYDGVRAFGTENQVSPVAKIMNDHLQSMRNKHGITLEHLRMGALKGIILDADATELFNLYTEFGITQKTIDFKLGQTDNNVRTHCLNVRRHIEDNLMGEVMSDIRVLCSADFMDALVTDESVEKVFLNHQAAIDRLGGDPRKNFEFGSLIFEEYRGRATDAKGNVRKFIEDGEAHAFPVGTMSTFETLLAPADFMETVNTLGKEVYAKQESRKFGRGVDLHTQSNPLPICYRPALLVKLEKGS